MNIKTKTEKNQVVRGKFNHSQAEKAEKILKNLKACTWKELETRGKFTKNDKLSFITDDTLIVGCDVGSETHYIRAIDARGRELSGDAFSFENCREGFRYARDWMADLAEKNGKKQIVLGLEPTGHYWFVLASWMVSEGISVVQVNPYAVKQTKEIEDNSQDKNDRKDPKPIANLVKDGNFGMPYLPEDVYADMRRLTMLRDQLMDDRIRTVNRLHRELTIYFPEYKDALGKKIDGSFVLELLKVAPLPQELKEIGAEGIRDIWHRAKLRGRGYGRACEIAQYAEESVGLAEGAESSGMAIRWFAEDIQRLDTRLVDVEKKLQNACTKIPCAEYVLEIPGIGDTILAGILSEMGDVSRFDDPKEIQKLSGLGLVGNRSGKHSGKTTISRRGRKRLRYWLFQAAKSAVVHSEEFKALHHYYTTREENPLKKMQSLIAISCKILRVIYAILTKGTEYDPVKMLADIRRPHQQMAAAA